MAETDNSCAIREFTRDHVPVGRCWRWLTDGKCPRHGNVRDAQERYQRTGELTPEWVAEDGWRKR